LEVNADGKDMEQALPPVSRVDLSARGNQLPPIVQPIGIPAPPMETEVSMKAMRNFDNYVDEDAEGFTCKMIPTAMVQGTNRLCCARRLIYGNDLCYFWHAQALVLVPTLCFAYGVFKEERLFVLAIVALGLAILMIALMWTTACLDPGIVPRDPYPVDVNPDTLLIRNGVQYKWCRTCHIYRPPRTKHCPVCDNCVDRFDHHCPWVGTCIGRRNYRYFFGFISTTLANSCFTLVTSIILLHDKHQDDDDKVLEAFAHSWYYVTAVAICSLSVPLVGSLVVYHIYLMTYNKTTNEDLNCVYDEEPNPFQLGCSRNMSSILCGTQRPSRMVPSTATMQGW